jgi:hypothetical protein
MDGQVEKAENATELAFAHLRNAVANHDQDAVASISYRLLARGHKFEAILDEAVSAVSESHDKPTDTVENQQAGRRQVRYAYLVVIGLSVMLPTSATNLAPRTPTASEAKPAGDKTPLAAADKTPLAVPDKVPLAAADKTLLAAADKMLLAAGDKTPLAVPDKTPLAAADKTALAVPDKAPLAAADKTPLAVPVKTRTHAEWLKWAQHITLQTVQAPGEKTPIPDAPEKVAVARPLRIDDSKSPDQAVPPAEPAAPKDSPVHPPSTTDAPAPLARLVPVQANPAPANPSPANPSPAQHPREAVPVDVASYVSRGDQLLAQEDVTGARLLYRRAAEYGDATAAERLARTYDPRILAQSGLTGLLANEETALHWYKRAEELRGNQR